LTTSGRIFLNENLNHPENRINVALFGLMGTEWFHDWFLEALNFPTSAVVYPPANENGVRPDLRVVDPSTDLTLGWVEVELGTNQGQVDQYRSRFAEPVRTVWGRREQGGDLSLEEVADRLEQPSPDVGTQVRFNCEHLAQQIRQDLRGFRPSAPRAEVSVEMRSHPLVVALTSRLGERLLFTTGPLPPGFLKADTTGEQGFSLRVRRGDASGSVSLLAISGGRPFVLLPPHAKLSRCLPRHGPLVDDFADLIAEMGCNLRTFGEQQRPMLPLHTVLDRIDDIAAMVLLLAEQR
jgi:hypothetical protein